MQFLRPWQRVTHKGVDLCERFLRIRFVNLDHDFIMDVHDDAISSLRQARNRRSEAVTSNRLRDILRKFAAVGTARAPSSRQSACGNAVPLGRRH